MKTIITTPEAPKAIGPYSQAVSVSANKLVFVSGQIPLEPVSMSVVGKGIEEQTHQVIRNLLSVLQAEGLVLNDVVKTTVFLNDMNNFMQMNDVYAMYFKELPPARSTVEVSRLPKDVLIEIDAIAISHS